MTNHTPEPTPGPVSPAERRAFLWKILDRYDLYIGTTLSRAGTVTALNTLMVGYVMLKAGDILASFGGHTKLKWTALVALGGVGVAAFVSMFFSFLAVAPYLGRSRDPKKSAIFFVHVAARKRTDFLKEAAALTDDTLNTDLAEQVHDVATGLSEKFRRLKLASGSTVVGLIAMFVLGLSVLISTSIYWMK